MRNPDFLNSGFRNSTSAFWSLFPDYNPVSALQNTILLFCNLFCIVIAQNNYSLPCFFCSKNKCCSLNLGMLQPEFGEYLPKRHLFQSTWRGSPLHRGGHHNQPLTLPLSALAVSALTQVPTAPCRQLASTDYCPLLSTPPQPGGNDICRRPFSFNKKQRLFLWTCPPAVIQQQLPESLS